MRFIQSSGQKTEACPYHQLVHLDNSESFQVNSSCESVSIITSKPWFVLPPLQAYYFKTKNPFYKELPPFRSDCVKSSEISMEFIYPNQESTIFLPKDFDGIINELILKVAHSKPETELYWYLNETYIGTTKDIHDKAILPEPGEHVITVIDALGNELILKITISE
jgi:penicillin-binding protein 1C